MYSPKINEEFIPILFKISTFKKIPMTKLVNQIIKDYFERNSQNHPEKAAEEPNEKPSITTLSHLSAESTSSNKH